MPLTQDLGRFASGLTFENLPREAVEIARTGFIDTIATMIAGADDPAPQLLRKRRSRRRRRPASLYFSARAPPRRKRPGSTAPPAMRSITTMSAAAAISRPCWCRRSSPRPRRWGSAGARCSPPMSPATRPGPSWRAATPATITSRAGTRPAFSARSERAPPAPRCAVSIRAKRRWRSRCRPRRRRHHGQFRHDDEAVPRRPRRACRAGLGPPRRSSGSPRRPMRSNTRRASCRRCRPRGVPTATARPGLGGEWQIVRQGLSIKKYPACYCTHRALDAMLDLLGEAAAEAGRDQPHHRVDQQDAFADPAQSHAADRARSEIQHGVRDGRRGDLAPRQPRRVHRRVRPPPRGAGADATASRS